MSFPKRLPIRALSALLLLAVLGGCASAQRGAESPYRGAPSGASASVRAAWERVPRDVIRAAGFGQQRLFILPSLDLVVVRFGQHVERPEWSDGEFLARVLGGS